MATRWSARCSEVKDFLARNQVPFRSYLSDDAEGERLLAAAGVPVQVIPGVSSAIAAPALAGDLAGRRHPWPGILWPAQHRLGGESASAERGRQLEHCDFTLGADSFMPQ